MKPLHTLAVGAASIFALDRLAKILMFEVLSQHSVIWIVPPWFNFTLVLNRGTAFGMFQNSVPVLAGISILILGTILYFYFQEKKPTLWLTLATAFLMGGALGNLFDRMFLGYVIDFINFTFWPTFNVADMSINAGIVGLVIALGRPARRSSGS